MKSLRILIAASLTAILAVTAAPALVPNRRCAPVDVPGIGNACRSPDGLLEVLDPRTGSLLGYTHGPDLDQSGQARSTHSQRAATAATIPQRKAVCATSSENHVELIYARASDDTDRYGTQKGPFLAGFEQANYVLNAASLETGPDGADYKVLCSSGSVVVRNAVLPTSKAGDSFSTIVADLKGLGYTSSRAKYLVLYDEIVTSGVAGTGQIYSDDVLSSTNRNLRGAMFAVSYTLAWKTIMHELSHTMGAVQHSAPHSTKSYHCTDGLDVMCYRDGGANASSYSTSSCPNGIVFDCKKDDYFNSNPKSGTYLATRWNLGSRLNTYIRFAPAQQ